MKKANHPITDTQHRILEAAGDVFAETGFRDATVRKICKRAGVNLAAVCYHFGDKEGLYFEVLRYWHDVSMKKYPMDPAANENLSPELRLRNFIHLFLLRILDEGKPAWFEKLFARELMDPTAAFDRLLHEIVRPFYRVLESILEEITGNQIGKEAMHLCCESIISQCLRYKVKPAIIRIFDKDLYSQDGIERVADHITQFSLTGLRYLLKDREVIDKGQERLRKDGRSRL